MVIRSEFCGDQLDRCCAVVALRGVAVEGLNYPLIIIGLELAILFRGFI